MWVQSHVAGRWVIVPAEELGWSLTAGRGDLSGLPHNKNQSEMGLERARRIILYILWRYPGAFLSHGEGISELVRISTCKAYRQRGIGQAIVTYLVNVARLRGDRRIIVKTNVSWHDALRLYQCLGFVEYGRTALGIGLELLLTAPEQGA
jgi:GNAT superfamily N-acetyltransferase